MKLLIPQLSDIHLKDEGNVVVPRAEAIARALHAINVRLDACLIAASGDIAFSGKQAEYEVARKFFDDVREHFLRLRPGVYYGEVFIPGNHDCDLPKQARSREVLVQGVLTHPPQSNDWDDSLVQDCLKVQSNFFDFAASRVTADGAESTITSAPSLYYTYRFSLGPHVIKFACYNTSWMSLLHEQPGRLLASTWLPPEPTVHSDLAVALLHHPFNWLEPINAKRLRQQIEQGSDVILTGHEHVSEHYTKQTVRGEDLTYFEGAVLQESATPDESGFNVFLLDLDKQEYKVVLNTWRGDIYVPESETDWLPFHRNRHRASPRLTLTDTFAACLDDCGATFTHPRKATLALSDLFVYPDLEDRSLPDRSSVPASRFIHGDQVKLYLRTHKHVLIMGPEKCGKSSLVKMLYRKGLESDQFPLLLSGSQIRSVQESAFRRLIERTIKEQYGKDAVTGYLQLENSRRVLMIDDLHRSTLNYAALNTFVSLAMGLFDSVVLLADDVFPLAEMARGLDEQLELLTFRRCYIKPLGHVRRGEIIEKWLRLGQEHEADETTIARRVRETEKLVTTLIGTNLLPASPLFVLTILQLAEGNIPHNTALGAYGYHYEALITASLSRTLALLNSKLTMDTIYTLVSRLAYRMFQNKRRFLFRDELEGVTDEYKREFSIRLSLDHLLEVLADARIMREDTEGRFVFTYRYAYYYFVSKYIATYLYTARNEAELRAVVNNMAVKLYVEDYANIIIFLVYLTKDERTITTIVEHARHLYESDQPCDLNEHVTFVSKLQGKPITYQLQATSTQENTRRYRAQLDEIDSIQKLREADEEDLYLCEEGEALGTVVQVNAALKMIQIMGQIICNFPGALPGETKLEIASESYALGLRMLRSLYSGLDEHLEEVREFLGELIKEVQGTTDRGQLGNLVDNLLFQLVFGAAYGVIKRLSIAAGSEHLADTYQRIPGCGASVAVDLIDLAIKLDHFPHFPEHNVQDLDTRTKKMPFAAALLRILVRDHFYLYPETYKLRQRVCARLGIQAQEPRMLGSADKQRR